MAAALLAAPLAATQGARAQEPGEQTVPSQGSQNGPRGGQFAGGQRVFGTVTAVSGANVTVKSIENGQSTTVVTTANTRLMKGAGEPLELSSLKPGDGVTAMGQLDAPTNTLHAAVLFGMSPDQTKQMLQAAAEMKANLGKTYIMGRVTALDLDNLKMTVQRPDGQAQTIGFDEGTSFKKNGRVTGVSGLGGLGGYGRRAGNGAAAANGGQASTSPAGGNTPAITGGESITLADIKVGDNVVGLGSVKAGAFIPSTLDVQVRGEGAGRRRGGADDAGVPAAATPQPAPAGPGLH